MLRSIQLMHQGVRDDATLLVIDIMPPDTTFPELCQGNGLLRSYSSRKPPSPKKLVNGGSNGNGSSSGGSSRGLCSCFSGCVQRWRSLLSTSGSPYALADPSVLMSSHCVCSSMSCWVVTALWLL